MIAVLYKFQYASNAGYNDPACTSMPCGWNVSAKKDVQAGKIMDMTIRKDKKTNKRTGPPGIISELWKEFDPRREGQRVVTEQQQESFLEGYRKIQPTAQLFYSSDVGVLPKDTMPLQITKKTDNYLNTLENNVSEQDVISGFMKILPLEDEQVNNIESSTRQQAKSSCWVERRKERITSSKFKDVHTKMETISKSRANNTPKTTHMVAELVFASASIANLPAVKWGTDNEDKAFREFHALALSKHENCKMVKSGICVLKDKPYIGVSPDGLMTCHCCQSACVKIKCSFSIREYVGEDKWHETDFLECVNNNIQLKRSHKYYYQITAQMAVTGIFKTFFVVWTTRGIFVELIKYDLEFLTPLLHNLKIFFKSYMVKVLLHIRSIFFRSLCDKVIFESGELTPESDENGVCCDLCGGWSHFKCCNVQNIGDTEEWL
jgi:hypothetical protein